MSHHEVMWAAPPRAPMGAQRAFSFFLFFDSFYPYCRTKGNETQPETKPLSHLSTDCCVSPFEQHTQHIDLDWYNA